MPAKQPKAKKSAEDITKPSSVSRPQKLVRQFNEFLMDASHELKKTVNHSEAVCALEELAMENSTVNHLLMKKLTQTKGA